MFNNISSNNIAVDLILKILYLKILKKQWKCRQLRYLGYIVNLYIQAFLLGKKADTILKELKLAYSRYDFNSIIKI